MKNIRKLLCLIVCLALCIPFASALAEQRDLIEYDLMVAEHSSQPYAENGLLFQEIEKRFGVRFNVTTVATDYGTKMDLLLASNEMPDVMQMNNSFSSVMANFAWTGIFYDFKEVMEEKLPNYYALYNSNPSMAMYDSDGHAYVLLKVKADEEGLCNFGINLRMDLVEAIGKEMPTTMDEYFDVLVALKEAYPDSVPFSSRAGTWSLVWSPMANYLFGTGAGMYFEPTINAWTYGQANESFKSMLDWYARLYAAGALDIDYATMNNQLWMEGCNTGKILSFIEGNWGPDVFQRNLRNGGVENALYPEIPAPVNNVTGTARGMQYNRIDLSGSLVVNADVKEPDRLLEVLDWMYSDEGTVISNWGTEGVTFEYDENGQPVYIESAVKEIQANNPDNYYFEMWGKIGGGQNGFCVRPKNTVCGRQLRTIGGEEQGELLNDPNYDPYSVAPSLTAEETETCADILNLAENYCNEFYDAIITGEKPVDEWDNVIAHLYDEIGIQKVIDIYNAAYLRALGE